MKDELKRHKRLSCICQVGHNHSLFRAAGSTWGTLAVSAHLLVSLLWLFQASPGVRTPSPSSSPLHAAPAQPSCSPILEEAPQPKRHQL